MMARSATSLPHSAPSVSATLAPLISNVGRWAKSASTFPLRPASCGYRVATSQPSRSSTCAPWRWCHSARGPWAIGGVDSGIGVSAFSITSQLAFKPVALRVVEGFVLDNRRHHPAIDVYLDFVAILRLFGRDPGEAHRATRGRREFARCHASSQFSIVDHQGRRLRHGFAHDAKPHQPVAQTALARLRQRPPPYKVGLVE